MTLKLHKDSHTDHFPNNDNLFNFLLGVFKDRTGFFIETIELPAVFGVFPCHLHGPTTGGPNVHDREVEWRKRGDREYTDRMCTRRPVMTREVTVVAGPHDGEDCILYTAYAGPQAPKSVNDPSLTDEERVASEEFWAVHALSQ